MRYTMRSDLAVEGKKTVMFLREKNRLALSSTVSILMWILIISLFVPLFPCCSFQIDFFPGDIGPVRVKTCPTKRASFFFR